MKLINIFLSVFILCQIETAKLQLVEKSAEILFCASTGDISIASLNESLITTNSIYKQTKKRFLNTSKPKNLLNVSCGHGLNYDLEDNYIVWSNITAICVAPIDKKSKNSLNVKNKRLILQTNEVHRLSLDWIHDLLYFIDSGELFVLDLKDSKRRKILDNQNKNSYIAIDVVVNPIESFIAWIQWDRRNFELKIVKTDQSGSNKKILVDIGFYGYESRFFNPSCLAIDYDSRRIYFIDSKLQTLESVLFDGRERLNHLQSSLLSTVNSLDIYGSRVYWSSETNNVVFSANKYGTNGEINTVLRVDPNIESIQIMDYSRQPKTDNRCASAQCQSLCIPVGSDQYKCVCDTDSNQANKDECLEYHNSSKNVSNSLEESSSSPKVTEVVITESYSKSYPLYIFKCQAITDENTNQTIQMDWFTEDDVKLTQKFKKSPIARNITVNGNTIELRLSYPYVKKLKTFKCRSSSPNDNTVKAIYKVIVRQLPANPKILSHSLSFAGVSKAYITLEIENPKVEPPIDKYRLVYRGTLNKTYYQKEYSVNFDAIRTNGDGKNIIYIVKLDVDYASSDLTGIKLFAHNEVGWSSPAIN